MTKILVYGASGAQAKPAARRLLEAGHEIRLLVRDAGKVADLSALGAEVVLGDMNDRQSLDAASSGMEGVFLLVPFFAGNVRHAVNAINAARAAGARKIVWNASGGIPARPTGNAGVDMRVDVLQHLRQSGLSFVALQPTVYMENLLGPWTAPEVAALDTLAYPIPSTVQLQWISHEDAAAFAVAAFEQIGEGAHLIDICGPQTLAGEDIAAAFSAALGRTITFRPMPPREFGAILDKAYGGGGDATAAFYEEVYRNPSLLSTQIDYDRLSSVLRIVPTPMQTFAERHAADFGGVGRGRRHSPAGR